MIQKIAYAAISALAFSATANAATITVSHVLSPASYTACCFTGEVQADPFVVDVGDTLDQTVTFTNGASVSSSTDTAIWFLTFADTSQVMEVSGTIEFLGASANMVSGPIAISQSNLFVHIGFFVFGSQYRLDAAPISFTGVRQILTVNSSDVQAPRSYNSVTLNYFEPAAPAIPEPATWAMLITGFGFVGAAMRRRRPIAA